jgi:KaiC/GvpD/RAD55 family RecA-like ATPase
VRAMPTAQHEVQHELTDDELLERLAAVENPTVEDDEIVAERYGINMPATRLSTAMQPDADYRLFEPLVNAADEYITFAQTPERRIFTGIPPFDAAMRGVAPRELLMLTGFAANGKTLFTAKLIEANRDRRICLFTPDETRVLVLVKLAALHFGMSAEHMEQRIAANDEKTIEMVRATARDVFPNLAVFDRMVDIEMMERGIGEACDALGDPIDMVIFDYSKLLLGYESPPEAVSALKGLGKKADTVMTVLHQSSRTGGADGKKPSMTSGEYGGEQQATFLIGIRRKKNELTAIIRDLEERIRTSTRDTSDLENRLADARWELGQHQNTASAALLKNKRPPSRTVDEQDFKIDEDTGRLTWVPHGDLPVSLADRAAEPPSAAMAQAMQRARGFQRSFDDLESA